MQYFILIPTTYGELAGTEAQPCVLLDRLPIDEIMSMSGGNVFVSPNLASGLLRSPLTGYKLENVKVSTAAQFHILHPSFNGSLPQLQRLKLFGDLAKDDFCRHNFFMAVSERALAVLNRFKIKSCYMVKIEEFPPTWEEQKKLLFEWTRKQLNDLKAKTFPSGGRQ